MIINFHPRQFRRRPFGTLFDVRKKNISTIFSDEFREFLRAFVGKFDDGFFRVREEAFKFCAGNKQDSVAHSAPTIIDEIYRRTPMICEHDNVYASAFAGGEKFRTRASGVRGIFGVDVHNRAKILVAFDEI